MPVPRPINSQVLLSTEVPWRSRGYHARGTDTFRPSTSWTINSSSVTSTFRAAASCSRVAEKLIPSPLDLVFVFLNQLLHVTQFFCGKPNVRCCNQKPKNLKNRPSFVLRYRHHWALNHGCRLGSWGRPWGDAQKLADREHVGIGKHVAIPLVDFQVSIGRA